MSAIKLTKEQIAQYRQVFDLFDKDHTGDITAEELGEVMKGLGLNPSDSELHDLIAEADVNKDGSIDFNEFLNMMARTVKEVDNEEELKNAFKVFDKDGSGTISAIELRAVLQHLGENLTDDDLDEMLKMADKNGDGNIDYEEFVHIMTRD
ncbi:EF-hand [Coniochaeta ligniaria NRRL 30616]|uniref:Calmodulin n=1 Tax=Coniochaeta ligniaria NRRL 30616 TaxID=1408157 RepID=A0A1J7J3Z0_9PEZI|nr:EF-hand [Coniochaeta ligniaria NRRL 30616]